jgi:hypothetical protein
MWVCIKLRIKSNYPKDAYGVYECEIKGFLLNYSKLRLYFD